MTDLIYSTIFSLLAVSLGIWCVALGMGIIPTSDDYDRNDGFRRRFGKPLIIGGLASMVLGGLWLLFG